ncbi:uncharacterized protein LOC141857871 [Brevipalpus obovatus]|uniref:uncharacterized protein LOC141857871 n=1 Tax=Brevipalpus obovatus TaxID=246614 RepID=UPI003D9EB0AD
MLNIFILCVLMMLAVSTMANPRADNMFTRVETPRYENDQGTVEQNVVMVEVNNVDKTQRERSMVDWRGHIFNLNDPLELDKLGIEEGEEAFKCCKLGTIAGIRGYHCHADLYTGNIMKRNENRPHNKRIYFRGKHHRGMYGVNLMSQFGQCSPEMSEQFDSCCRVATRMEMKMEENSVHLSR